MSTYNDDLALNNYGKDIIGFPALPPHLLLLPPPPSPPKNKLNAERDDEVFYFEYI